MEKYIQAGKIAKQARELGFSLIKKGEKVVNIINQIEEFIESKGAQHAFPTQISINQIAAHYTSLPDDKTILKKGDLVKLDLGVHIEGRIADTAITKEIETNNHKKLIETSKEALEEVIKIIKPGLEINKIGKKIDEVVKKNKLKQIKNLSGHQITLYEVHGGLTIPTHDNKDTTKLKEDQIIAIEPFITSGTGLVKEGKPSSIYKLIKEGNVRTPNSRKILKYIKEKYKTLPFCTRQLTKKFPLFQVKFTLNLLQKQGIIYQYPQLPEVSGSSVAQTEHTIIVKDKPIVTTK